MASIPEEIERVALLGWCVYPAARTGRKACIKNPTDQATYDLDTIAGWCREFHQPNWRVVFGPSGLWGLDCDVPPGHAHDGIANLASLTKVHGPLPPRPQLRSGGGGIALFFRWSGERIIGEDGHPALGIDPRRGRQSQTIPPSRHWRTGLSYRWVTPPWEASPPKAPEWLLGLVEPALVPAVHTSTLRSGDKARNYAVGALRNAIRRVAGAGQGGRNNLLNREAFVLARFVRDGHLAETELRESLLAAARANGLAAEDGVRAVLSTIQSGLVSGCRA